MAAALSDVQASAVDLAVEQAVLRRNISDSFVNLGRRNQNLLSRQLDFITELERNETDPDTPRGPVPPRPPRHPHAPQRRVAARARRHRAAPPVVRPGARSPTSCGPPSARSRTTSGCVVRHLEPASVTGAVAADLAHVLAELIENALSFSPPDQSVEVKGRLTTAGYTLAITDNGLGMAAEDVERANRRLAGKESFTVAPVPVPRALRGRPPRQPPRHRRGAAGQPGRWHHRSRRRADGPARRRRARPHRSPRPRTAAEPVARGRPSPGPAAARRRPTETTTSGLPRRGERAGRRDRPRPPSPSSSRARPPPPASRRRRSPTPAAAAPAVASDPSPSPVGAGRPSTAARQRASAASPYPAPGSVDVHAWPPTRRRRAVNGGGHPGAPGGERRRHRRRPRPTGARRPAPRRRPDRPCRPKPAAGGAGPHEPRGRLLVPLQLPVRCGPRSGRCR